MSNQNLQKKKLQNSQEVEVFPTKKVKSTKKNLKNLPSKFLCEHCNKEYKTESGLYRHSCKKKTRWNEKDERHIKLAFKIFVDFNNYISRSKKEKSFVDFIDSQFYDYFKNLSIFILNGYVILYEKYYNYLFKNNINMKTWDRYSTYQVFLLELYKIEQPSHAVERTLNYIGKWAEERNECWVDFFNNISPSLAIDWILYGKISPWVLYCNNGYFGMKIFSRISDEQLNIISRIIDPIVWSKRLPTGEIKIQDYINMMKEQGM